MSETYELKTIGHVRSDFPEKFGIPRQAGIVDALESAIIFEPEYRREEALRGMEGFSHIWVIWQFSEAVRDSWSPTVRPPRLGGNARMGVFATRSPFRPNALGLGGYLDIGLFDTMEDLFVNFIGALVFSVIGYFALKKNSNVFVSHFVPRLADDEQM